MKIYEDNFSDIDIVFIDMILPGLSGDKVFNRMKMINPQIKAIVVSGYSKEGKVQNILDCGAKNFLQKPFGISKLARMINAVLTESN